MFLYNYNIIFDCFSQLYTLKLKRDFLGQVFSVTSQEEQMYIDKKLMSVFEEYGLEFKKHRLNMIKAPCGSGKTYFFFNYLCKKYSKKRILYVVDTTHLKRTMKKRHNDIVSYDKTNIYRLFLLILINGRIR